MQNSREAFEKYIRKSFKCLQIDRVSVDGEYTNRSMQGRWLIWQESRNHLFVEIPMMSAKNSKSENRIIENIIIFIEQQGIKVEIPPSTPDDQHLHQPAHKDQAIPDGWKLVPIEMTDDIGEAIAKQARCCGGIALDIYEAALAATPKPEAE